MRRSTSWATPSGGATHRGRDTPTWAPAPRGSLTVTLMAQLDGPRGAGRRWGGVGFLLGFRRYVWTLILMGAYRLDLRALSVLREGPPVVLAPNHPSLIDALLIIAHEPRVACVMKSALMNNVFLGAGARLARRSEEHTSELQSRLHLVCRLLLEKKKKRERLDP